MRRAALLLLALPGCGGPSLTQLVDGKHYREALCYGADGSPDDRAAVTRALDADEQLYVNVRVVSPEELRPVLADGTDEVSARAVFARGRAQGNVLPVDRLKLAVSLVGEGAHVPAKPLDWATLAWATHEPLPSGHTEETYLTGINVWRGLEFVMTAGLSVIWDPMRPSTVTTDATPDEYKASAPRAFALHEAMPGAHCEDVHLGGGGQSCEAYFVVDAQVAVPVELEVKTTYEADRQPVDNDKVCSIDSDTKIVLAQPRDLAQRTAALFGDRGRPLGELSATARE